MRFSRSLAFLTTGTLALLVYAACGSDSPSAPTPDPTPQPTTLSVTVNITTGSGIARSLDRVEVVQTVNLGGGVVIQVLGGNGTANDVAWKLNGKLASDMTPFVIEGTVGVINGTAEQMFSEELVLAPPLFFDDPLFVDLDIQVTGMAPNGDALVTNRSLDDVLLGQTDPVAPPQCGLIPNTACPFDGSMQIWTEFPGSGGQRGNLVSSGQPSPQLGFANFASPGSSSQIVSVDLRDLCATTNFFQATITVFTNDSVQIFIADEDGRFRRYDKPGGISFDNISDPQALICDPSNPDLTATPSVTSTPSVAGLRRGSTRR